VDGAVEHADISRLVCFDRRGGGTCWWWREAKVDEHGRRHYLVTYDRCVLLTNNGRWLEVRVDFTSLWSSYEQDDAPDHPSPPAETKELTDAQAAAWLDRCGYSLPQGLQGRTLAAGDSEGRERRKAKAAKRLAALSPHNRAISAAYSLLEAGKPVSVNAACALAHVDRANLRKNHPDAIETIKRLGELGRAPKSGGHDKRTGDVFATDDPRERE
jgi:hypothetical protein